MDDNEIRQQLRDYSTALERRAHAPVRRNRSRLALVAAGLVIVVAATSLAVVRRTGPADDGQLAAGRQPAVKCDPNLEVTTASLDGFVALSLVWLETPWPRLDQDDVVVDATQASTVVTRFTAKNARRIHVDGPRAAQISTDVARPTRLLVSVSPSNSAEDVKADWPVVIGEDGSIAFPHECGVDTYRAALERFAAHRRTVGDPRTPADLFKAMIAEPTGPLVDDFVAMKEGRTETTLDWAARSPELRMFDASTPADVTSRLTRFELRVIPGDQWAKTGQVICTKNRVAWGGNCLLLRTSDQQFLSLPVSVIPGDEVQIVAQQHEGLDKPYTVLATVPPAQYQSGIVTVRLDGDPVRPSVTVQ